MPPEASPATTGAADPTDASRRTGNPWVVLAIVVTATFMQLVDVSIVNVAIPSIRRELSASYAEVQLVLVLYQLAFASTLITAGRLGDLYGRRRLFLIGMAGFVVSSALCGAAPTAVVLIAARFVQGLFAGAMFPQVLSIIQVTFPREQRGRAFGAVGAVIGVATVVGPLLGGVLIALDIGGSDWRSIFYVNVPVGLVALAGAWWKLGESRAPRAERLDVPGAILITLGVGLLVFPLTVGRELGWPVWVAALLLAAAALLAWFTSYERRRTERDDSPLLRMTLFDDRAFTVGLVVTLVFFLGVPAFFFSLSLYLQVGLGFSALASGLTTFPFAVGSGVASALSDRVTRRLGTGVLAVGASVLVGGMLTLLGVVHAVGPELQSWQVWPVLIVAGTGLGLFVAPLTNVVLAGIRSAGAGSASGVFATAQRVGGALGVAAIGIVLALPSARAEQLGPDGFTAAYQRALAYEAGVFAVALVLVLCALPRSNPSAADPTQG